MERLSEGNEARRGGETSEPLHSTGEAGEPAPRDPVEGRRRSDYGTSGGTDATDLEPCTHLNATTEDSDPGEDPPRVPDQTGVRRRDRRAANP